MMVLVTPMFHGLGTAVIWPQQVILLTTTKVRLGVLYLALAQVMAVKFRKMPLMGLQLVRVLAVIPTLQ